MKSPLPVFSLSYFICKQADSQSSHLSVRHSVLLLEASEQNYSQDVHSSCLSTGQHCNMTSPEAFAFSLVEHLLLAFLSCFVSPFVICLTHCIRTEFCCFYHVSPFVLLATFPLEGQSCCKVILSCCSRFLLKDKAATRLCYCSLFLRNLRTKLLPGNWSYCSLFLLKKKAATRLFILLFTFCVQLGTEFQANSLSCCSLFLFEDKEAMEEGVKVDLGVRVASLPWVHHVFQGTVGCGDAGCHLWVFQQLAVCRGWNIKGSSSYSLGTMVLLESCRPQMLWVLSREPTSNFGTGE